MKKIRKRMIVMLVVLVSSGAALLHTSQSVQQAEKELAALKKIQAQEQESIRVLRAEEAYLGAPQRLEGLSEEYLDLLPPSSEQMTTDYRDVSEVPKVPVPPKKFYHNISQSEPKPDAAPEKEKKELPAPVRKPKKPVAKNFDELLSRISEDGEAQ